MVKQTIIKVFLLWLLASCITFAVETKGEKPVVEIKFYVYGLEQFQGIRYQPTLKQPQSEKINFYSSSWGGPFNYRGYEKLEFFYEKNVSTPEFPNKFERKVIGTVNLTGGGNEYFLLFFPEDEETASNGKFQIYPIDGSASKMPKSSFRFVNVTPDTHIGMVGNKKVTVVPGLNDSISISGKPYIKLARMIEGKPFVTYEKEMFLDKNERTFLIIFPPVNKRSARIMVKHLSHFIQEPIDTTVPQIQSATDSQQ